jgi:hypothetical protein
MDQTAFLFRGGSYLAAALPLLTSTIATYFWRQTISRPWLFWIASVVALYFLLILAFTWAFTDIGISGVPSQQQGPASNPLVLRIYLAGFGFIAGSALLLCGLRAFMIKR